MPESSKMSHKNTKISGRINASWCCSVVLTTCWVIIITDGQACKNFVDYNELLTAKLHCVSKIGSHLMFDNNIDKCGLIFEILSPTDAWANSLCTHKGFHLSYDMLLHCLVKAKNPKMLLILTASSTNCWHVPDDTLNIWFNIWQ